MTESQAVEQVKRLKELRDQERPKLDRIREYLRDDDEHRVRFLPEGVPREIRELARIARVNMLRFVVKAAYQQMFVEGYRAKRDDENVKAWDLWQRNRMDVRQIGIHKAALAYGKSYATVLPGQDGDESVPVIRGHSPRDMTTAYGDDDVWPEFALEWRRPNWRLYDKDAVYTLSGSDRDADRMRLKSTALHGAGVTPVIRYRETDDLDDPRIGLVEPHITLQDQINITTFGLLVVQHYGGFPQRWVVGWMAETEQEKLKATAGRLWTFEDSRQEIELGEFKQADLKGYIDSREATLRHLSTVSETPAHELLGQLVNLSAEALAAAENSQQRAAHEYRTVMGESHEQTLSLGGQLMGARPEPEAEARWRDTESRSLNQAADALGKLAAQLGVPPEMLWEMIPGVSQTQVERWKAAAQERDVFTTMLETLDRQSREEAPAGAGVG